MSHDIFLSYARATASEPARALRDALLARGASVFLDEREIADGAAFPAALAEAVLDARAVVVFVDPTYLSRPWCVHEWRLLTAAYRLGDGAALQSVVVALPAAATLADITPQLPPPLAAASWPTATHTERLADAACAAVAAGRPSLRERLSALNDDTARAMMQGADVPLPAPSHSAPVQPQPAPRLCELADAPESRGDGYVGRSAALWWLVHESVTARAFSAARCVVVRGLGGSGKTQLAAEFLARYGTRCFEAGAVWVDADAGPEALGELLARLARALGLAPPLAGEEPRDPLAAALRQVGAALRAQTAPGRLLWVVDNLPAPGPGARSRIEDWCPALGHATVLVTTRRADSLRAADATLSVDTLSREDAVRLLVRPPVDVRWLAEAEWAEVARWAGDLPLALAVLREGLIAGGLSAGRLRDAARREPAAEIDRLMAGLRGEVDDRSLRGAAEAFDAAWQSLAGDPAALRAAECLALLAPVPLPEALVGALIDDVALGRLLRRGWLDSASAGGTGPQHQPDHPHQRHFRLHRLLSSVLRMKASRPQAAYAHLAQGLQQAIADRHPPDSDNRIHLHLRVATERLLATGVGLNAAESAPVLALVETLLGQAPQRRGLRWTGAVLAQALGAGEAAAQRLAALYAPDAAAEAVCALPALLRPLGDSGTALRLMDTLLHDARPEVRRASLQAASDMAPQHFGEAMWSAIMREDHADATAWFDRCIADADGLVRHAPRVIASLGDAAAPARAHAARMLGRVFGLYPETARSAATLDAAALAERLTDLALQDPDATVRQAAADALWPLLDDSLWLRLSGTADAAAEPQRSAALEAITALCSRIRAPAAAQPLGVEVDDEGRYTVRLQLGTQRTVPPSLGATLVRWCLGDDAALAALAHRLLADDPQHLQACVAFVEDRLEAKDLVPVHRLAEALADIPAAQASTHWWRARAWIAQGDSDAAIEPLEALLRDRPSFTDAVPWLAWARVTRAQRAMVRQAWREALDDLQRALTLEPRHEQALPWVADCLLNLGEPAACERHTSAVLADQPDHAVCRLLRAEALAQMGRLDEAEADLRLAREALPGDRRVADIADWLIQARAARAEAQGGG